MAFVINSGQLFMTHFRDLANHLKARGAEVMVICPEGAASAGIRDAGYRWADVPIARSGLNPVRELRLVGELSKLYARNRLDIVHHVTAKAVINGSLAARRTPGLAVVNTISGLGYAFAHPARAVLLRAALAWLYTVSSRENSVELIFENHDDRQLFIEWGIEAAARSSIVPGTGVDCDRFRPVTRPAGTPTFAFVGRLLRDKGFEEFLEAARLLRVRGAKVRLAAIGGVDAGNPTSMTGSEVDRRCRECGVDPWGWRDDMAEALGQVDAVVLPSWREGFPRVLQEAAAAGLPAIATDVPGCRSAIDHGENGLLIPVRDPRALADAIAQLATDRDARVAMGIRNRARALQSYSAPATWANIVAAYEKALSRANARRDAS